MITGKGRPALAVERGVLKRQVPLWLKLPEFRSYVIGFETAHVSHGGEGALYVRVRRAGANPNGAPFHERHSASSFTSAARADGLRPGFAAP